MTRSTNFSKEVFLLLQKTLKFKNREIWLWKENSVVSRKLEMTKWVLYVRNYTFFFSNFSQNYTVNVFIKNDTRHSKSSYRFFDRVPSLPVAYKLKNFAGLEKTKNSNSCDFSSQRNGIKESCEFYMATFQRYPPFSNSGTHV